MAFDKAYKNADIFKPVALIIVPNYNTSLLYKFHILLVILCPTVYAVFAIILRFKYMYLSGDICWQIYTSETYLSRQTDLVVVFRIMNPYNKKI